MGTRNTAKRAKKPDLATEIADTLRPTVHRLSRRLRREAAAVGMSAVDLFVLGTIKLRPGIGVSELAALENITRPTMSSHVKRLREAGWVIVREDPDTDQRRSSLLISDSGLVALAQVRKRSNDWLAQRIGELAPEKIEALSKAMSALTEIARIR